MIRVHKQADIFISGDDVKTLKRVCDLAALKLDGENDSMLVLSNEERKQVRQFINRILYDA